MKIVATSFKWFHVGTVTLSAPNPAASPCWPTPPLETPGHSWAINLVQSLVGSLLLLLGPGEHKVLFVPSKSLLPMPVKSSSSVVGLTATSSKRAYATPASAAPRAPVPVSIHRWPPQETLKHSSVSVSVGSLGPGVHKFCLSPLSISGGNGIWF